MNKIFTIALLLAITGCNCKTERIDIIEENKSYDPKLSCLQIEYEWGEQKVRLESLNRKYQEFVAYSQAPWCIHNTAFTFIQAIEATNSRIDKLEYLYGFKNCAKAPTKTDTTDESLKKVDLVN